MAENFLQIQKDYLQKAWARHLRELKESLPAHFKESGFHFQAFGEPCELYSHEIILGGQPVTGPEGILIALYALHVQKEESHLSPLKSFKQFPGGMAYYAAFSANAEQALRPYIKTIQQQKEDLVARFSGHINSDPPRCDFSFTLYPLPRLPLYYLFYLPDDEVPASVTCLFPSNATRFLPVAGLADTAEYTAKKLIDLVTEKRS